MSSSNDMSPVLHEVGLNKTQELHLRQPSRVGVSVQEDGGISLLVVVGDRGAAIILTREEARHIAGLLNEVGSEA